VKANYIDHNKIENVIGKLKFSIAKTTIYAKILNHVHFDMMYKIFLLHLVLTNHGERVG
jgi:hypothetical protein